MSHPAAEQSVKELLGSVYGVSADVDAAFTEDGMSVSELIELHRLASETGCTEALEIGMARGTSSVVICAAISTRKDAQLISIDPFQHSHYRGAGVASVGRAGFSDIHELREAPDYLALSDLVREGRRFDLVFVDGWHSFDYALVDIFFADLLLRDQGVLPLHDTDSPAVYKAARFLETHKPYERVSPAMAKSARGLAHRVVGRLKAGLGGAQVRVDRHARRTRWKTLAAYRKRASVQTPEPLATDF